MIHEAVKCRDAQGRLDHLIMGEITTYGAKAPTDYGNHYNLVLDSPSGDQPNNNCYARIKQESKLS